MSSVQDGPSSSLFRPVPFTGNLSLSELAGAGVSDEMAAALKQQGMSLEEVRAHFRRLLDQRLEVVRKLQTHLGALRGKRIALLGLAFKLTPARRLLFTAAGFRTFSPSIPTPSHPPPSIPPSSLSCFRSLSYLVEF